MAKVTGRSSDQFNLRLPDGMREEIKRLADEDGQSMNTKIIALLEFATNNSGLDIDALIKGLADQQAEIARLSRKVDTEHILTTSVLWQILAHADEVPPSLTIWADSLLRVLDTDNILKSMEADKENAPPPEDVLASLDALKDKEDVEKRVWEAKKRRLRYMDKAFTRVMDDRAVDIEAIRKSLKLK